MRRWQKTSMGWDCHLGLETSVPVTDWHKPDEKHFHKIQEIEATALPDRKGQIEIKIMRLCVSPTTERNTISEMLSSGLWKDKAKLIRFSENDSISVRNEDAFSGVYIINFQLDNGEYFCDTVIHIVRKVLSILGVEDEKGYYLANFKITQETFVRFEESWISFANWLRISHRLPVMHL